MTDIVLFPAHHWHLVWVTSYPSNCLSFLAAAALYSLFFSMILIIIYSLILRPRLLLCFQVMYSFTDWFIGEERGKREGKALRWKISKFHDFWVSERVPKFLGVLEAFPCTMKALSFCVVCFILQYFMILIYSESCWFVTSFSSLPQEEISLETPAGNNALKWDTANEQLPSDDGFCYLPCPCRILQHLITSKHDKGKTKPPVSLSFPFPFTSCRLLHSEEEPDSSPAREVGSVIKEITMNVKHVSSVPSFNICFLGEKKPPNLPSTEHPKSLD